jgi:glycosyltransferase involved in cell wall biosynthesis
MQSKRIPNSTFTFNHCTSRWRIDISNATPENTAAIIPAYNAEKHLAETVGRVSAFIPKEHIIIVDDGSTDGTYDIAASLDTVLLQHEKNIGKGAALLTGIRQAQLMGMHFAMTIDADGQHNPAEIPKFFEIQRNTDAAIVIGNRMSDTKNMPFIRVCSNTLTSLILSFKMGKRVPDTQSGFRLLNTGLFDKISIASIRYEAESEMLIKAAHVGAIIESVPVETIYEGAKSSIHPIKDSLRFLHMVIKSFFW